MKNLICPICSEPLEEKGGSCLCRNRHCFDRARQGYLNFLAGNHKSGSQIGDNRDMALSRRAFLEKNYFAPLCDGITDCLREDDKVRPFIVDICCGEGYYGSRIKDRLDCEMAGFDISKEMIRLACSRKKDIEYFVANISRIPLRDECADFLLHLFAPFHEKEFRRITKPDGRIISVVPGENHLFELKEILYASPYKNDGKPPETTELLLAEAQRITYEMHLKSTEDILSLFRMTPYFYHTDEAGKKKLSQYGELKVTADFMVYIFQK